MFLVIISDRQGIIRSFKEYIILFWVTTNYCANLILSCGRVNISTPRIRICVLQIIFHRQITQHYTKRSILVTIVLFVTVKRKYDCYYNTLYWSPQQDNGRKNCFHWLFSKFPMFYSRCSVVTGWRPAPLKKSTGLSVKYLLKIIVFFAIILLKHMT